MGAVLEKNYRYAFNLIKYLALIIPSKMQVTVARMSEVIGTVISRKKKSVLMYLLRKKETQRYSKSKSCICLASKKSLIEVCWRGNLSYFQSTCS